MNTNLLISRLARISRLSSVIKYQMPKFYTTKSKENEDEEIPTNPLKKWEADVQENGVPHDKKPFKYLCEEGKIYYWCLCGHSHSQPFCDRTHKNVFLKIKQKPIKFTVTKTKDYYLCTCKQTQNRPFCDGSHKKQEIQEMRLPR